MLEAPAWGPKALLSRIRVVLIATPEVLCWGYSWPFSSVCMVWLHQRHVQDDFLYPKWAHCSCCFQSNVTAEISTRVISFSPLIHLDLFFIYFESNRRQIFESCFPSMVRISRKSINRYMSNSFHLSGLSLPESNQVRGKGKLWIRWAHRFSFQGCSSRAAEPSFQVKTPLQPSFYCQTISGTLWGGDNMFYDEAFLHSDILVHLLEGSSSTSLIKIEEDFLP